MSCRRLCAARISARESYDVCISNEISAWILCVFHHQKNETDKKAVTGLKELQQELERSAEECKRLREKLAKTEAELQTTVEE